MESQPQNPEFRNNPENFHPCIHCNVSLKRPLVLRLLPIQLDLTLYRLVSSADYLCKKFGPRTGPTDLDPNCLTL